MLSPIPVVNLSTCEDILHCADKCFAISYFLVFYSSLPQQQQEQMETNGDDSDDPDVSHYFYRSFPVPFTSQLRSTPRNLLVVSQSIQFLIRLSEMSKHLGETNFTVLHFWFIYIF